MTYDVYIIGKPDLDIERFTNGDDDNHLQFEVTEENIYNRLYLEGISRKAVEWAEEIHNYDNQQ